MRDWGITASLAPQVPEALVPLLAAITFLGSPTFLGIGVTLFAGAGAYREWLDRRTALRLVAVVLLVLGVSAIVKNGLAFSRPPTALHRIPEDGFGFPSGHATATTGAALTLATLVNEGSSRLRFGLAGLVVVTIAATRILLGVHYVGDVLAGILLGAGVVVLGLYGTRRYPVQMVGVLAVTLVVALVLEVTAPAG